ncbi:MAG: type I methionyl aminopeptidase [Candidatus Delongbacteria bacterium]|nr:type I methionyl aminopeptidase [Candidatus Delongbacteria bacterium]
MIQIYSEREFELIRQAAQIIPRAFEMIEPAVVPGITTGEINRLIDQFIRDHGAEPSFIGVPGNQGVAPFPAACCISVNEEVVHGLPGKRVLREGDVVGIDVGTRRDGYYGDSARTFAVGVCAPEALKLMEVTRQALQAGISAAVPGHRIGDIGHAVQQVVDAHGYGIVREMVGHGVGAALHEPPEVPNYGRPGVGLLLKPGMCLALEPMINIGKGAIKVQPDGWTVVTADGSLSVHFEHQIQITENEPQILTEI